MNKEQNNPLNGPEYWMSLEQYAGNPEFAKRAENEFMSSPFSSASGDDDPSSPQGGFARRDFLKFMGASIAMTTTACIRRPVQMIIPYAQAPKEVTPGEANYYASTWFDGNEGCGLLVKTLEGRPLKFEGNPLHPMNLGSLPARAHAAVLNLYDPDRLQGVRRNLQNKTRSNHETINATWDEVDGKVVEQFAKGPAVILTSTQPSPSTQSIIADFLKAFPGGRHVSYDALPTDAVREAQRLCYGKAVMPRYRLDQAKLIVAIEADFFGTYLSSAEFMKQWSKVRKPGPDMARLVMFEANMSLTGMNADDRVRIKPSQQLDAVLGLAQEVMKQSKGTITAPAGAATLLAKYDGAAARIGAAPEMFAQLAQELIASRGRSLIIAGGLPTQTSEAVELQVAVNLLNSMLGNDGHTVDHDGSPYLTQAGSSRDLSQLIADMSAGKVKTLIIHDMNPAYTLPVNSGFVDALKKVDLVLYTGNRNDETGKLAHYVLPSGTQLESWSDFELQSGVFSIQQPTIRPMYDTRSFGESLLAWTQKSKSVPARAKAAATWYDYVQATWKTDIFPHATSGAGKGAAFQDAWNELLQNGVVLTQSRDRAAGASRAFVASALSARGFAERKSASTGYELVLYPTVQVADGRYANVAWMQELPDPVTKIVWDNYASISLATARKEGLKEGDMVELKVADQTLTVPVHIQPGVHDEVFALAVGYGQKEAGKVAKEVGVNAYQLASFNAGQPVFSGLPMSFKKTGEHYRLVSTHEHHSMEGRQIVVETTNKAYQKNPHSNIENHKIFSIWPAHTYTKHKWAMSVDLNVCTGCSACVIACQSENNVPVVGKRYVMQGREMHWIRVDRYFKGTPEAPEGVFMPLMCQQCETAPCETVCPVLATVHNDEGLNDMVYNRCVGTRYCSNNCPYKVRRFNWFNYSKREAPTHMALNPDVTVRSRGVMEKCTFCVHRIRAATSANKDTKKPGSLVDGKLKTACQQTCPTNAIIFGDLNDKNSEVHRLFQEQRSYALLEDLNTQPRVRYLTRVRNADRAEIEEPGAPVKPEAPDKVETVPARKEGNLKLQTEGEHA
jgi:MoCo/4Fe-4S cofactor protein with predicted Tat translocation signal